MTVFTVRRLVDKVLRQALGLTLLTCPLIGAVQAQPSVASSSLGLPAGTILTAHASLVQDPTAGMVYDVANGPRQGCSVRVPARTMARNVRPGRVDTTGAILRCPAPARPGA